MHLYHLGMLMPFAFIAIVGLMFWLIVVAVNITEFEDDNKFYQWTVRLMVFATGIAVFFLGCMGLQVIITLPSYLS